MPPHPNFYADDHIPVGVGNFHRFARRHQFHVLALADHDRLRETEDAGERNMQIGEDAGFGALDHVLAKPGEVAGSSAAGIDRGGHTGLAAELIRVDAERSTTPINMGVQIDQAGRYDVTL